jgi:hypothetical protein
MWQLTAKERLLVVAEHSLVCFSVSVVLKVDCVEYDYLDLEVDQKSLWSTSLWGTRVDGCNRTLNECGTLDIQIRPLTPNDTNLNR